MRNIMKIAVRYQSRGGNTKAVAEIIAKTAGVKAEPIDTPLDEAVDVLFVGGGVYAWEIDTSLKNYLETLNLGDAKSAAIFSTSGFTSSTDKIAEIVRGKGIHVCVKALSIKMGIHNQHLFGGEGEPTLSDKKIGLIHDFVMEIIK